jgi:hypothetical protein
LGLLSNRPAGTVASVAGHTSQRENTPGADPRSIFYGTGEKLLIAMCAVPKSFGSGRPFERESAIVAFDKHQCRLRLVHGYRQTLDRTCAALVRQLSAAEALVRRVEQLGKVGAWTGRADARDDDA